MAPTAPQLERAAQLEREASNEYAQREESFQRCDTDGFLSQWASGLAGRLAQAQASLLRAGGVARFPGLYRRDDGIRVAAKLIRNNFGSSWAFCDAKGTFLNRFLPDSRGPRSKLFKAGYIVLGEWCTAKARYVGHGTGLSGTVGIATKRTDGGFPGVSVVDRGGHS